MEFNIANDFYCRSELCVRKLNEICELIDLFETEFGEQSPQTLFSDIDGCTSYELSCLRSSILKTLQEFTLNQELMLIRVMSLSTRLRNRNVVEEMKKLHELWSVNVLTKANVALNTLSKIYIDTEESSIYQTFDKIVRLKLIKMRLKEMKDGQENYNLIFELSLLQILSIDQCILRLHVPYRTEAMEE